MTREQILELDGRELDAAVATGVMGECAHLWRYNDPPISEPDDDYPTKACSVCGKAVRGLIYLCDGQPDCKKYSADLNHAAEMEREIERRGLGGAYCDAVSVLCAKGEEFTVERSYKNPRWFDFKIMTTPALIRARATVIVCMSPDTEKGTRP